MIKSDRIGAIDVAGVIAEQMGSYVDMNSIQFLVVQGDRIHCCYQHPANDGPTFSIEMTQRGGEWTLDVIEQPPGREREAETTEPRRISLILMVAVLSAPMLFWWFLLGRGYAGSTRTAALVYALGTTVPKAVAIALSGYP